MHINKKKLIDTVNLFRRMNGLETVKHRRHTSLSYSDRFKHFMEINDHYYTAFFNKYGEFLIIPVLNVSNAKLYKNTDDLPSILARLFIDK